MARRKNDEELIAELEQQFRNETLAQLVSRQRPGFIWRVIDGLVLAGFTDPTGTMCPGLSYQEADQPDDTECP